MRATVAQSPPLYIAVIKDTIHRDTKFKTSTELTNRPQTRDPFQYAINNPNVMIACTNFAPATIQSAFVG